MCLRVVLLDIDNTLGGNLGGIEMATIFDVICEQHEKKEAFKNKIVEKRLQKKNLKRVVSYNVKHTTYFNKEEYILYSLPIVTAFRAEVL